MLAVLLVAAAAGALTTAILAVLRPNLAGRLPAPLIWVAAVTAAVAVGISDAAPTGTEPLDLSLRVLFGFAVPVAAARAGALVPAWGALVATGTLLLAESPGEVATGLASGAFLALVAAGAADPASKAVVAAAAVGPLAHAEWGAFTGDTSVAMAVATVPVLLVGIARAPRMWRRRIGVALTVAIVVLGAGAVAGLVAAISAASDVNRAVDFATAGIDRLGDDDDRARSQLLDAAGAFGSAEEKLTSWWARSALLVPGVAQQSRAVTTMASAGVDLARTAADATEEADVDAVRPRGGVVDLRALAALEGPLRRSVESLARADRRLADVESALLLPPVDDRLSELRLEVGDALESADLAAQAVGIAPRLLGADGPRRWFIAFQNPAESTGNGGFLGSWAELVTDGGRLELTRTGRNRELTDGGPAPEQRTITGEPEFVATYGGSAARYWGNINFVPDHPTVGRIIAELYPQSGGGDLDGVVAITPRAMAGFLELTGPIDVPGYPQRLDSGNVERILLHEQYLEFPGQLDDDREAFLGDAIEVLFDQLTAGELAGPRVIAEELGPAVRSRDLLLWARDDAEQALFRRIGAAGEGTRSAGVDPVGVVTQNLNGNKIDWFLHREISYDVAWSPDSGAVEGTLTARIRNDAPSAGLPASVIGWGGDPGTGQRPVADGENLMWVFLYAPHPIEEVTVDGEPVDAIRYEQLGLHAARFYLSVPSQSVREVQIRTRGVAEPGGRHVVRALRQPLPNPDQLELRVRVEGEWCLGDVDAEGVDRSGKAAVTRHDATTPAQVVVDVEACDGDGGLLDRLRRTG